MYMYKEALGKIFSKIDEKKALERLFLGKKPMPYVDVVSTMRR